LQSVEGAIEKEAVMLQGQVTADAEQLLHQVLVLADGPAADQLLLSISLQ